MRFFSLVEINRSDFRSKLDSFLNNSEDTKFCVNLNKDQLADFSNLLNELKHPEVRVTLVSRPFIVGISSSLCIFEKNN